MGASGIIPEQRMSILRWLLIVPVSVLGWYLVFVSGMGALGLLEYLCADEQMISGRCIASWYVNVKEAVIIFLAGLSAIIVVLAAYYLAPTRKTTTAIVAFLLGSAAATYVVINTDSWFEYAAAITGGFLTTVLVSRKQVSRKQNSTKRGVEVSK